MADTIAPPPEEHVLDATGHMHVVDAPIDLSHYTFEAWISFAFFWVLASDIFYQFFTRYALNDSAAWTEEIARYLLICVVFIAVAASVRTNRHIHVDFFYRLLPAPVCRVLSTFVDVIRVVFFGYAVYLFGFACACARSVQVLVIHWRQGYSVLERPETALDGEI